MKSFPTQPFYYAHDNNISVFPSKHKGIQKEVMQKLLRLIFPMYMRVEWVWYKLDWKLSQEECIYTQQSSTPHIPIVEDFEPSTLCLCPHFSPHTKAAQLSSRCAPGRWHVWSETSKKGQRGWSKADQKCATLALLYSRLMHEAALWGYTCSLHLFPWGPLVMPII